MGLVTTFLGGRERGSRLSRSGVSRGGAREIRATALNPRTVKGPSHIPERWAKSMSKSVDSRLQPEALPHAEGKVIMWGGSVSLEMGSPAAVQRVT